ncbi:hypothetical protein EYZ11_007716 [Aspergillus tanneri]|uniref:Mid2 domain-containing protein n=1 Tax=Aspergillus tanneri TaxID=1220188 RepID=A0A4V3UNX6_9EURO|nr:uncharacterized protein ATNIH1004_007722 [Aspergillus tanneri]KAA8646295.1 hypothetical protein ATNIH1004_007722 [Aspergillus tanneri]THC92814.1 hypothetical protein EYZ11_007716 [Aspergillus tanneri]
MSHHGNTRHSRLMRRKYRSPPDQDGRAGHSFGQNEDSSTESILSHGSALQREEEGQGNDAPSDQESELEKRQQAVRPDDQTTVLARVISVVDQDSQALPPDAAATAHPTSTKASQDDSEHPTIPDTSSDPSHVTHIDRPTVSDALPDFQLVTTASSASSHEELPTALPGYPSPSADIPTMTTSQDTLTTTAPSSTDNAISQTSVRTSHAVIGTSGVNSSSSIRVSSSVVSTPSPSPSSNLTSSTISTTSSVHLASTTADTSTVTSIVTYGWGDGSGATNTGAGAIPTTTDASSGASSSLDSETKGKIAGGVVGGVAGALILLVIAFLLLRQRKKGRQLVQEGLPAGPETGTALGAESVSRSAEMASQRSSNDPLFTASYFAPAFMRRWRQSNQTIRTDSTIASSTSERGFQKISGRKIPSVLQSGGDGYGGGFEAISPTASEPSMSPASPVHPRSPTAQPPPSVPYGMQLDTSYTRETEESDPMVIFRPSPARTPVAGSASASLSNEPMGSRAIPQVSGVLSPTIPKRPDMLGRSHPSFDGSRGSRFSENL